MLQINRHFLFLFSLLLVLSTVFPSTCNADDERVTLDQRGLQVSWQGATYLRLVIASPDGSSVDEMSIDGSELYWPVPAGAIDGRYSYEVRAGFSAKRERSHHAAGTQAPPANPTGIVSGHFIVEDGVILLFIGNDTGALDKASSFAVRMLAKLTNFLVPSAYADIVHADDVIITGNQCIGSSCATDGSEAFGNVDFKIKDEIIELLFSDTSIGSFPTNDWKILINSTSSGGPSYFSIEDVDSARRPFTIEAGAPANSLYVEDYGRVGLGTSLPYVELHIADGDTPTVRLDQDGSSGWAAQTWDIAGNETNFFIRDVTNGSLLSFRIGPDTPSNTLCLKNVEDEGKVGIGTWSPSHTLHVEGDALVTGNFELGSSRSLKDDIRALESADAATTLANLQPVRFHYKHSPAEESLGFIAEDVPDLVATNSRKTISTMDLVAVLTQVVKDQQATITTLQNEMAELARKMEDHQLTNID